VTGVAPKAQAMYISLRNPTTRDSMMVVINRRVAEKAVCSREGLKSRQKRRNSGTELEFRAPGEACIKRDSTRKECTFRYRKRHRCSNSFLTVGIN
jgi:hypothetical protein